MPIFRLQPIELRNPRWNATSWRHSAIVRAANVDRARAVAQRAFSFGTPTSQSIPPWTDERLVDCFRFDGSGYPEDGPDEVLDPPGVALPKNI